jgi:hypothetical protein
VNCLQLCLANGIRKATEPFDKWIGFFNEKQEKVKRLDTQDVPGGKVNILGGHSIGHSKQKTLNEHVSYSERFPR